MVAFAAVTACGGAGAGPSVNTAPEPATPSVEGGASSPARSDVEPRNGLEVVGAMRRAHPAGGLKAVSFTIEISEMRADSAVQRFASGVIAFPGRSRVAYQPASRKDGVVRDRERLAVFDAGKRVSYSSRVDVAQLLAYDVFAQRVDSTILWLDIARVRLGLARRDRWDGRNVWVVGAANGDTTSTQFWVDDDRWRVLRVIQRDPRRPSVVLDVRYRDFDSVMRVPFPRRIEIYRDGRHAETHVVSGIVTNPRLPSRAFDVQRWRDVKLAH